MVETLPPPISRQRESRGRLPAPTTTAVGVPALCLWALALVVGHPLAVLAQPRATGTLTIEVVDETGRALGGVDLATILNGQKQPRATTAGNGVAALDVSILNLGKGTPVQVVVVRCGEEVEVQFVPPNEKSRCENERDPQQRCECRDGGFIPWGPGRLVVRLTPGGATTTFIPEETGTGSGVRTELTLLGAWKRATYPNLDEAARTVDGRFQAANYTQFSTEVVDSDNGFGLGAALRVLFGGVGVQVGYAYQNLGTGEVHATGTRTAGNLAFQLDSVFDVGAHKVAIGVPIGTPRFVLVPYYGRAFWTIDRTIVDSLRAGGTQVAGGTASDTRDGSSHMFGARAEVFFSGWLGGYVEVERLSLRDVFEADGPDGLPVDHDNTNVIVGFVIRLPFGR